MASDRQIEANRNNARRSTGPRTPLGKARASLNAVRHGLSARNAVLPDEDREAYLELHASLDAQFQPQGPIETFLVGQMASAQWRLQRLARIETGFFIAGMEEIKQKERNPFGPDPGRRHRPTPILSEEDEATRLLGVLFQKSCGCDSFALLTRYENMLNAEYFRALRNLTSLRNARHKTNPIPPPAVPPPPPENRRRSRLHRPAPSSHRPTPSSERPAPHPGHRLPRGAR